MSKSNWYFAGAKETLGGIKCIKHSETGELELNGKYGFIWEHDANYYKVCITSATMINKYCKDKHYKYSKGEEKIIKISKTDLALWVKRLKIVENRKAMVKRANEF